MALVREKQLRGMTTGSPDGVVPGRKGTICEDIATGDLYQNTDGDKAWVLYSPFGFRPYTAPPSFTATNLNAPTIGNLTLPYTMRTIEHQYVNIGTSVKLFYQELQTLTSNSWQVLARVRGLSMGVGFSGFGLGVRFQSGIYLSANIIRNNAIGTYVIGLARYNASGIQVTTANQDGTAGEAWSYGRWLQITWSSTANTLGTGVGELAVVSGIDGYNFDPVEIRVGNLVALGTGTSGIGAALAPYNPVTANYILRMAVESLEVV